jgi:hypothetical protein
VGKLSEPEAQIIALRIAASSPDGIATATQIKDRLPRYRQLTSADLVESPAHAGEETWQRLVEDMMFQQGGRKGLFAQGLAVRAENGIKITEKGRAFLAAKGL